jgi:hypothetical protein
MQEKEGSAPSHRRVIRAARATAVRESLAPHRNTLPPPASVAYCDKIRQVFKCPGYIWQVRLGIALCEPPTDSEMVTYMLPSMH